MHVKHSSLQQFGEVCLTHQVDSALQMLFTAISTRMVLCSTPGPFPAEFKRCALCGRGVCCNCLADHPISLCRQQAALPQHTEAASAASKTTSTTDNPLFLFCRQDTPPMAQTFS